MEIGERLAILRGRRSQRQIARAAGIDPGTLSRIERGEINPSVGMLKKIARGLDLPLEKIVEAQREPSESDAYADHMAAQLEPYQDQLRLPEVALDAAVTARLRDAFQRMIAAEVAKQIQALQATPPAAAADETESPGLSAAETRRVRDALRKLSARVAKLEASQGG